MNSNPEPMFKYSVANVVINGWLNIEDDVHPLYRLKVNISLSAHVFNNKVQNQLIIYLEGQKHDTSNKISNLK